ncbi:MAG: hypothetical protein L0L09_06900 [Staphylococcus equorum]|nr:hypothetical protein [Lactococcus lactis]MDN6569814.1 hypothetical protein [Staphylococcus equorum]MDN6120278.1 hypothetical protein [Lactococcus lactis]MDN6504790.1 hypothetical protein [Lactococcus lactis]MDN6587769.1 hypothetical protein [Lactococcus lactis]
MEKTIFSVIRGVLTTVITIGLLLGYIWFVFDLNMLAWGTLLVGIMLQGTVAMFAVGLWSILLSYILFFVLGMALIFWISVLFDKIEEYIFEERFRSHD